MDDKSLILKYIGLCLDCLAELGDLAVKEQIKERGYAHVF